MAKRSELNVMGLGLSLGITMGAFMLLLGWAAWLLNWGTAVVEVVGSLYLGYAPTLVGGVVGGLWAAVDWFIGGVIIAWLYNKLQQ